MDKNLRTLNQINVDPRAKKSRMSEQCIQYKMGNCSYGKICRYSHVDGCKSNLAKYSADEYRSDSKHLVRKTTQCWKFWNGEFCPFGQNCHFLHDEPVGKACYRKTKLCHRWEENGSCLYGPNCRYAHGQEELTRFRSQFGVQRDIISNSRKRSATSAARGPYCGTANESARDQEKKRCLFKSEKKFNGIYADWIEEVPLENCSLDEVAI